MTYMLCQTTLVDLEEDTVSETRALNMRCCNPSPASLPLPIFSPDTAYAKNKETGKWYNFDDSHVSETSASNVVVSVRGREGGRERGKGSLCTNTPPQSPAAYVLFYHRRTEGRPAGRSELNRSLSVSFEEEVKKDRVFVPQMRHHSLRSPWKSTKKTLTKLLKKDKRK